MKIFRQPAPCRDAVRRTLRRVLDEFIHQLKETFVRAPLSLLCGILVVSFAFSSASAEMLTFNVTGSVTQVNDAGNVLGGAVTPGQRLNGSYSYETSVAPQPLATNGNRYVLQGTAARIRLTTGSLTFESNPSGTGFTQIEVYNNPPGAGSDWMSMTSNGFSPLANGATIGSVFMQLNDSTGTMISAPTLPITAPSLANTSTREIRVPGSLNGQSFGITLRIDSITTDAEPPFLISPASGSFVMFQNFDASVIFPRGASIFIVRGRVNGVLIPQLHYPGACTLAPPSSSGRTAVVCPNAHLVLHNNPTAPQIDWSVELTDGTVLTQVTKWKLVQ